MMDSDRLEFGTHLTALLETFGQEGTKALLLGYWHGLNDLPIAVVKDAIGQALRQCERLPRPAELRKLVGQQITPESKAIAAWSEATKAVSIYGPYKSIAFEDRIVNAVIRHLGGCPNFCSKLTESEEQWVRKDFIRVYQTFVVGGVSAEALMPVAGLNEVEVVNGVVGTPIPKLVRCTEERLNLEVTLRSSASLCQAPALTITRPIPMHQDDCIPIVDGVFQSNRSVPVEVRK